LSFDAVVDLTPIFVYELSTIGATYMCYFSICQLMLVLGILVVPNCLGFQEYLLQLSSEQGLILDDFDKHDSMQLTSVKDPSGSVIFCKL